ncbi:hypothetical protein FE634_21715 [Nocardioides dongxiaopingii]|uniref:hypothetical protein n=1 Tax=Nocardioides TaxID=1839 RepID=UPI0010C76C58|nr:MULTISPECIES: hypothetical protein [Nocardioides]QDH10863.1 hypothetical protein FE634_21715 [Nocardioides sp. S-1144]
MKIRMSVAAVATVVGLGALSACGDDETDTPTTDSSSEAAEDAEGAEGDGEDVAPGEGEDAVPEEPSEAPAEGGAPVAVGETITDDVLGDTITVAQVLRDFPAPAEFSGITEDGGELVLVEVEVSAGDEFSGGVQGGFKLLADGDTAGSATTIADEAMTAAGYPPFEGVSSGEQGGGWLCFQVNSRAETYELEYTRAAANIIGSDDSIEEEVWTVALP